MDLLYRGCSLYSRQRILNRTKQEEKNSANVVAVGGTCQRRVRHPSVALACRFEPSCAVPWCRRRLILIYSLNWSGLGEYSEMLERRATVVVESSRLLATVMYLTAGSHGGLLVCLLAQRARVGSGSLKLRMANGSNGAVASLQ